MSSPLIDDKKSMDLYMQNARLNYKIVLYHHGWATKYGICGSSEAKILSRDGDRDNSLDYITVWITM